VLRGVPDGAWIERCVSPEQRGWLELREALWSHCSRAEHLSEMQAFLAAPERFAQFVAYAGAGDAVGIAEASIRHDYVNGTVTSPVGFLEGLYVIPPLRGKGMAAALVNVVANWARAHGCAELASDTESNNLVSQKVHEALGFRETERVVCFSKRLVNEDL
jgi:aminoglycoside 6'-N-acetyltransferase I